MIHYLSAHDESTKFGVEMRLFLKRYRICTVVRNLDSEVENLMKIFTRLRYPELLQITLKEKARMIRERRTEEKKDIKYLVAHNSDLIENLREILKPTNVNTVTKA